jgi:hypothetical protein
MICPRCSTKLVTFKYIGYYDEFYGYQCACKTLPQEADSKAITGAYAYGHDWDPVVEDEMVDHK